ncbi:MAG: hypothetical protein L6R37_006878 [Teloschistes peruensis]|nr:MAG: hypothetical protein L6R37_006878 [Teloschistes peruensis]
MPEHSLFTKAVPTEPSEFPWTSLPQEIKCHVLSFADLSDLKSARLVCWNWADTASRFLFEELWLTPWTLYQLEDERSLQTVRPHVRSLMLFSEILPECSLETWQKAYKEWQVSFEKNIDLPLLSDADDSERVAVTEAFNKRKEPWLASEVDARFNNYSDHFRCQARFFEELGADDHSGATAGKNLPVLEKAINSFYNLLNVMIGDDFWFQYFQYFQYFQSSYTLGHSYYRTGKRWNVWQDVEDLDDSIFDQGLPSFGRTFLSTVLKTLGHSRQNLLSLCAGTILFPTFESFTRLDQEDSQAVKHTFSNLDTIVVVLSSDGYSIIQDEKGQTWLADVLCGAKKLRDVDVTMYNDSEIEEDALKLFWSRKTMLCRLRIANMAVTEDLFSSFLHRNAQTLQEIELDYVHLQETHRHLRGNGWGNLLKPFAGMIQIETIQLFPDPWTTGTWVESSDVLLEDPTCAQLLGEGLVGGVWEYEEKKFEDLCRALCLVHDTIPTDYSIRFVGWFVSAD